MSERKFVCIEHGEIFVIGGKDFEDARESAQMYGGECIRELTKKEYESHDGKGGYQINL